MPKRAPVLPFKQPTSRAERSISRSAVVGGPALPKGERIVLTAIAQYPGGVTREQLTVLTGYKRSTRDAYIQRLRERGLVEITGDRLNATDAGIAALGPNFEPLPTGDALRAHWMANLPEGERRVLGILIEAYPKPVEREHISDKTGYQRSSRDAYLQRLSARRLVVPEGRGQVRVSEELFG
jgi:DNA-binding IclR family transcriptional regulator